MAAPHPDPFGARDTLDVGGRTLEIFRLDALAERFDLARLPFSPKVLPKNLLRTEDGQNVAGEDIEALAGWERMYGARKGWELDGLEVMAESQPGERGARPSSRYGSRGASRTNGSGADG